MSFLYGITNPDASYDWLHSVLKLKPNSLIDDYVLECGNDFETFFERHIEEIREFDINKLEIVVFQVTTNSDECKEIQKNGLHDLKWKKVSKPYVVKFNPRFMDFAYFTFYGRLEDYMEDYNNHWLALKRWLFSRAVESSFSNSASQIFAYLKPATVISPDNIIDYIPAEKWREDVLRFFR